MGLLSTALGAVGGLLFRKVTSVADDGAKVTKRKPKAFTLYMFWMIAIALVYQILVWPVLNYHFPEYGFPPIEAAAILSALSAVGGL